jgi:hypothetical protein
MQSVWRLKEHKQSKLSWLTPQQAAGYSTEIIIVIHEKRILKTIFFYVTSKPFLRKLGKIPARIAYYQ